MALHLLMTMSLWPAIPKQVTRIMRDSLWHGRRDVNGSQCLVNWQKVCRPLSLEGLGIPDLQRIGVALRMRWMWFPTDGCIQGMAPSASTWHP